MNCRASAHKSGSARNLQLPHRRWPACLPVQDFRRQAGLHMVMLRTFTPLKSVCGDCTCKQSVAAHVVSDVCSPCCLCQLSAAVPLMCKVMLSQPATGAGLANDPYLNPGEIRIFNQYGVQVPSSQCTITGSSAFSGCTATNCLAGNDQTFCHSDSQDPIPQSTVTFPCIGGNLNGYDVRITNRPGQYQYELL